MQLEDIRPGGNVDLGASVHERVSRQDHVMLPTVETVDPAVSPLVDHQAAAVPFTPE